jgi:hypothetical protein
MLYAAKCYWPGVTELELGRLAARVAVDPEDGSGEPARTYLGSLLFPGDQLVLCLFEASSVETVRGASERAGLPCERVMNAVWLGPTAGERENTNERRPR